MNRPKGKHTRNQEPSEEELEDLARAAQKKADRRRRRYLGDSVVRFIGNGVQIQWLATKQMLQLKLKNPLSEDSGFSFSFNPDLIDPRGLSSGVDTRFFDQPLRSTPTSCPSSWRATWRSWRPG